MFNSSVQHLLRRTYRVVNYYSLSLSGRFMSNSNGYYQSTTFEIQVRYSFVGAENTLIFGGMMDLNWAVLKFDFVFGLKFLHVQGPI